MAEIFNLVLARTEGLLVHKRGIEAFGRRPRALYDLGGGWQRLDTTHLVGSCPEFPGPQAVQFLAESTDAPALAAQISSASGCSDIWAATPDWRMWRAHLPLNEVDCGWTHVQSPTRPQRDLLLSAVGQWAVAAGLPADLQQVERRLTGPEGVSWEQVPDFIRALGLPHDEEDLVEPQLDPFDDPFRDADVHGDLFAWMEQWVASDNHWRVEAGPMFGERMRLVQDIYDSMYPGGSYSVEELIRRIDDLRERGGLPR
ncbi:hypothetical protein [Micromonospora chersina]|uniref:hypothetical protein n=1 Tax=Micromonospora chersina TaxID=47854 RepID=UPI0033FD09DA